MSSYQLCHVWFSTPSIRRDKTSLRQTRGILRVFRPKDVSLSPVSHGFESNLIRRAPLSLWIHRHHRWLSPQKPKRKINGRSRKRGSFEYFFEYHCILKIFQSSMARNFLWNPRFSTDFVKWGFVSEYWWCCDTKMPMVKVWQYGC